MTRYEYKGTVLFWRLNQILSKKNQIKDQKVGETINMLICLN